jgi:hypothetical protein
LYFLSGSTLAKPSQAGAASPQAHLTGTLVS